MESSSSFGTVRRGPRRSWCPILGGERPASATAVPCDFVDHSRREPVEVDLNGDGSSVTELLRLKADRFIPAGNVQVDPLELARQERTTQQASTSFDSISVDKVVCPYFAPACAV